MEKAQPLQQIMLRKHRTMNLDPYLIPYTKPTQNGLKKCKIQNFKTPETDYRGKAYDMGLDSDFNSTGNESKISR